VTVPGPGDPGEGVSAALSCAAVAKRFPSGVDALDGIDLSVPEGSFFGLLGPNGAGKTTLIRSITGLTRPTGGSIRIFGVDAHGADAASARRMVGYAPQDVALDRFVPVRDLLVLHGRYFGMTRADARARADEMLQAFDLSAKATGTADQLSGGMRRRLSLARALVNDPRLLLLDEPTTGLDPQARHLMWERLQRLLQQGKSILLTTHFMDEAERLCSRLLVLDHGRKIAEGRPRELIAEHLESDVVEAYGNGALTLAHDAQLRPLARRIEVSGETVFFYTQDARPLLQALAGHGHLRTLHRPANLEDLFLKLTGRQIREEA